MGLCIDLAHCFCFVCFLICLLKLTAAHQVFSSHPKLIAKFSWRKHTQAPAIRTRTRARRGGKVSPTTPPPHCADFCRPIWVGGLIQEIQIRGSYLVAHSFFNSYFRHPLELNSTRTLNYCHTVVIVGLRQYVVERTLHWGSIAVISGILASNIGVRCPPIPYLVFLFLGIVCY